MRDAAVSLPRLQQLHPQIREQVIRKIESIEAKWPATMKVRIVQGLRTIEEQNALYALGRTVKNPDGATPRRPLGNTVTNAPGGRSMHNYALAFDFALMYDKDGNGSYETLSWDTLLDFDRNGKKDWQEVVAEFKALGYTWGGDFKTISDSPHIENNFGHTWQQLKTKYDKGDFIPGTRYVNL